MRLLLVILAGAALAAFTYLRLERVGARAVPAILCRAVAWAALGVLLLNVSCPVAGTTGRPIVLLDASLSMSGSSGRWAEARDSAARWGDVRPFGDEREPGDTAPSRGRSLLAPALMGASSSGRPVIVVTDGEIEDAADLAPDALAHAAVRLFPRRPVMDLAVTDVTGPARVAAGDSISLEVEVSATGAGAPDTVSIQLRAGATRIARRRMRIAGGRGRTRLSIASTQLGPGDHVIEAGIEGMADAEPRTDTRLHLVSVTPTPGVVLLAGPGDWDSRFFYRALRDVAQLPVQGFVRLDPDHWRSMHDLRVVTQDQVRRAARRADLLVLKGGTESYGEGSTARGILRWPAPANGDSALAGDWYLADAGASPLAAAFLGQPIDSFPPAIQVTPVDLGPGDWVALTARLGRRGAARPAVVGRVTGRTRRMIVAVDGLWRWAFRGGSSEETYRSWVAASASWLLGGADSAAGVARAIRPVVENGRPVVFDWIGPGPAVPTAVKWTDGRKPDTLRFDGAGHAALWLAPGVHRYRLDGGGGGTIAVEQYSDELRSRPVTLVAHEGRTSAAADRRSVREWLWLFLVCGLAFAGEWLARRRLGLR